MEMIMSLIVIVVTVGFGACLLWCAMSKVKVR